MIPSISDRVNPYIGARPFRTGERLYGREREVSQLCNLILAERIVLLHSPSGAGKTSLIHAAIIPRLTALKLQVMPVMRVNLEPAAGADSIAGINRYAYSALLSLEEGRSAEQRNTAQRLAGMSLAEYLAQWPRPETGRDIQVLIFDQFEELLILNPTDVAAKRAFVEQIGEVLEDPRRWALFAMREDFVPALEPYALAVPSRFVNTFRLDLLRREMAQAAIQAPARAAGVQFDDDAAASLVDDLRRVRVQQLDGAMVTQLGPHVEPMQLQVTCHRLWEALPADADHIGAGDLSSVQNVDQSLVDDALADYYALCVAQVAAGTGTRERIIREWFDRRLITESGVRNTVLMGQGRSGDLPNAAMQSLIATYLVRGEKRAGVTWLELAHDRLINPVRANNDAWFRANLSVLQIRADAWGRQGRPESMLLRGAELKLAQHWALEHADEVLPGETDFLTASAGQEARARRSLIRNRIIAVLGVFAVLLAVLAGLAFLQADEQRRNARAGQLAAQAETAVVDAPLKSLLLAVEAMRMTTSASTSRQAAEHALRAALENPHGMMVGRHDGAIRAIAFGAGKRLVTGSDDKTVRVWKIDDAGHVAPGPVLRGHVTPITAMTLHPEGRWLATSDKDGMVRLWDLNATNPSSNAIVLDGGPLDVYSLVFSPDGHRLAAGGLDGMVRVWDVSDPQAIGDPMRLKGHTSTIFDLAFSPDGQHLASASQDQTARIWDLSSAGPIISSSVLTGHTRLVSSVAFSPDGLHLATAGADGDIRLWDLRSGSEVSSLRVLQGHADQVTALAFSPDGRRLASGSRDKTARVWDVHSADPSLNPLVLRGHDLAITALDFSRDGQWLATASRDKTARLWNLLAADPEGSPLVLRGHDLPITTLSFNRDDRWLATGSEDGSARIWPVAMPDTNMTPLILRDRGDQVNDVAFSPDGRWLASSGGATNESGVDTSIHLWRMDSAHIPERAFDLRGHTHWIQALAFSPDGRWLATAGGDSNVRLWDLTNVSRTLTSTTLSGHSAWVSALAISPDGRWLATGSEDKKVRVWDLWASDPALTPTVLSPHTDRVRALAFTSDSNHLATTGGFTAQLWDMTAKDPATTAITLAGHSDVIVALAISPDGRWLATADGNGKLLVWDLQTREPARSTQARVIPSGVKQVRFSPDAKWLVVGGDDGMVRLWALDTKGPAVTERVLAAHTQPITSMAFSPNGNRLATGDRGGRIMLWEMHSGDAIPSEIDVHGHDGDVTQLRFSPDGKRLASSGLDGTVRLWVVDAGELVEMACRSAGRNFTTDEWDLLFPGETYRKTCVEQSWSGR